jgi:hypothetical protein
MSSSKRVRSPHPARFRQLGISLSHADAAAFAAAMNHHTPSPSADADAEDEEEFYEYEDANNGDYSLSRSQSHSQSYSQEQHLLAALHQQGALMGEFVTSPVSRGGTDGVVSSSSQKDRSVSNPHEGQHQHRQHGQHGSGGTGSTDKHTHANINANMNTTTNTNTNTITDASLFAGRVASLLCMSTAIDDWSIASSSFSDDSSIKGQARQLRHDVDHTHGGDGYICADCTARLEAAAVDVKSPSAKEGTTETAPAVAASAAALSASAVHNNNNNVNVSDSSGEDTHTTTTTTRQQTQSKSQSSKESEDNIFPPALTPLTPLTPAMASPPPPSPAHRSHSAESEQQQQQYQQERGVGSPFAQSHFLGASHESAAAASFAFSGTSARSPPLSIESDIVNQHQHQQRCDRDSANINTNTSTTTYCTTKIESRGNIRAIQTYRKRYLNRIIADAVLSNPLSLRSYCHTVHDTAEMGHQRRRKDSAEHQRLFDENEQDERKDNTATTTTTPETNTNPNHQHEHPSRKTSPLVPPPNPTCSQCHRPMPGQQQQQPLKLKLKHEEHQQQQQHPGHNHTYEHELSLRSSAEISQQQQNIHYQHHHRHHHHHHHRRYRIAKESIMQHLVGVVVDAVLDHIPHIAITFQVISDATEYNVTIALSLCHLSSSGMAAILGAVAHLVWEIQGILWEGWSMLNPWVAVDITTEVLASGIQSVAEGVGSTRKSASAAIQHYLSRTQQSGGGGDDHTNRMMMTDPGGINAGNLSVQTAAGGGITSAAGASNSRSSSRGAAFLLGIPGVVQVGQALAGNTGRNSNRNRNRNNNKNKDPANKVLSAKLYKKLNKVDSTSKVIEYRERYEDALSGRAKQRVQRMMHYEVSLRPFTATVVVPTRETLLNAPPRLEVATNHSSSLKSRQNMFRPPSLGDDEDSTKGYDANSVGGGAADAGETFSNVDFVPRSREASMSSIAVVEDDRDRKPAATAHSPSRNNNNNNNMSLVSPGQVSMRAVTNRAENEDATLHSSPEDGQAYYGQASIVSGTSTQDEEDEDDDDGTPFLCTPKSFPPTPGSRFMVMARGSRFAEDVVFFAREHLRLQDGLESSNDRTRSMALALRDGRRLAVFSADDAGRNIALSCGQHCATKIGNVLYCTTRCMVPVLRNCHVYFEMSVANPVDQQASMPSLSIGLSTPEMPNNTLVGAWKSSIGLLTTGQVLAAGQWYSPSDSRVSTYGNGSTVGCLMLLDDAGAFETWDGMMVPATVTFNVDGNVVLPPAYLPPHLGGIGGVLGGALGGPSGMSMMGMNMNMGGMMASQSMSMGVGFEQDGAAAAAAAVQPNTSFSLYVPREEDLYATLTLHSPATQVMCRFCAEDVVANTRESIGAPPGVTVYAVDGSVLIERTDNVRR